MLQLLCHINSFLPTSQIQWEIHMAVIRFQRWYDMIFQILHTKQQDNLHVLCNNLQTLCFLFCLSRINMLSAFMRLKSIKWNGPLTHIVFLQTTIFRTVIKGVYLGSHTDHHQSNPDVIALCPTYPGNCYENQIIHVYVIYLQGRHTDKQRWKLSLRFSAQV